MNENQILKIVEMEGISLATNKLATAVAGLLTKNPTLTDAQLVSTEDGSIKHYIRTKIGFFVDLFWGEIEPYIEQAIALAIPQARAIVALADPSQASG